MQNFTAGSFDTTFQNSLLNCGTVAGLSFIAGRELWLEDDRMSLQTKVVAASIVLPHDAAAFLTVEPL